jgi:hypothetical protein
MAGVDIVAWIPTSHTSPRGTPARRASGLPPTY